MVSSTLDQVKSGTRVLIDAPIFIYHFTGTSAECRDFLCRCEDDVVRELSLYQEQVDQISQMEIDIVALDLPVLSEATSLRKSLGFLTNDSLLAATARLLNIQAIASADQDFSRLDGTALYSPTDISW